MSRPPGARIGTDVTDPTLLPSVGAGLLVGPLHGAAPAVPVPHWVVLLAVVPTLWLVIGAAVVAVDRLLRRFGA